MILSFLIPGKGSNRKAYLLNSEIEQSHEIFSRRLFGSEMFTGMLVKATNFEPKIAPNFTGRGFDVAQ